LPDEPGEAGWFGSPPPVPYLRVLGLD